MHRFTQERLETLLGWYDLVRRWTLRLLDSLSPEELAWQPSSRGKPAQWIFAHLAATEELCIYRRLRGEEFLDDSFLRAYQSEASFEASRDCPLAKDELHVLLARLKRRTGWFLKRVLDGKERAASPDVLSQLERLIFYEIRHQGQVQYLRKLFEGEPSPVSGARPPADSGAWIVDM